MKKIIGIILFVVLLDHCEVFAQTRSFDVSPAQFSSLMNDEISPVFLNSGVVFCSTLKNNSLITYKNNEKKLFSLYYVPKRDSVKWGKVNILAKELTSGFNDGPATFNDSGTVIFFCRNNNINDHLRDISDPANKLGIFSAELINGAWENIRPFEHNDPLYSFITPSLTPDAGRLYFASDRPGGYGGTDLYYCDWKGNNWSHPVNLGRVINTPGNEAYPFICKSGKLFFASDGHPGLGKKDLFYSLEIDGHWLEPVHLDADINSTYDDFGLVTDENFETGFFSSDRRKTDDIFRFVPVPIEFPVCDSMVKNQYCFIFDNEYQGENDSIPVRYEWDFGNGIKKYGEQVRHCFPGPGEYKVILRLVDFVNSDSVLSQTFYEFELTDKEQAYINSPDYGVINEKISFNGLKTNLPDFTVNDYLWNFGTKFDTRGPVVNKVFNKKGKYTVQLGLLGEKDSVGNFHKACSCKKIQIFDDYQELAVKAVKEISEYYEFYATKELETLSLDPSGILEKESRYDKANSLLVRTYLLDNLSELQKEKLVTNLYSTTETAIGIIDQTINTETCSFLVRLAEVLKENSDLKLEVAVHSGVKKSQVSNLEISEKWANELFSYLISSGVEASSLHCKGYGESRPVLSESFDGDSYKNGRVEFILMNSND